MVSGAALAALALLIAGLARFAGVRFDGSRVAQAQSASPLRGEESLARLRRQARARALARRSWLASPGARAQRAESRMAFHGLSAAASQRLLVHDYGPVLAGVTANPAASVARMGSVVRYLSDYRALVRTPHGLRIERSSVPLRVEDSAGVKRPIDLGLVAHGGGFMPVAPLTGLSISRNASSGVAVGSSGLRVTLQGADAAGKSIGGQSVFFGGVGRDMDAVVAPKLGGVELFAVLRSRLSPEQLRYKVALPRGATLNAVASGAVVSRDGVILARIPAPSARDAQGNIVPVQMQVVGDALILNVAHRSRDVAYPLLVDPEVTLITASEEGWVSGGDTPLCAKEATATLVPPGPGKVMSISVPSRTYPHKWANCEKGHGENTSGGGWGWTDPSKPAFSAVEFFGIAFSSSETKPESVEWQFDACGQGEESEEHAPPPVVSIEVPRGEKCEESVAIQLLTGLFNGNPGPTTASASLSVEAILVGEAPIHLEPSEIYGLINEAEPNRTNCELGYPVDCTSGDQVENQTDISIGGRGPGLNLARTYNSQLAAAQSSGHLAHGPFGYGWTSSYSAHLAFGEKCVESICTPTVTVNQDDGSTVTFERPHEAYIPTSPTVQATLAKEGTGYLYTLPSQTKLEFNSEGRLTKETDRNGNSITLAYNAEKQLETATDGAGRKLTFTYNVSGEVESVKDPMGHTVKYTYEAENLKSVTQPAESALRWQFKYNEEHEMTSETDGRGHTVTTEYDTSHRVISQEDGMGRTRKWEYGGELGVSEKTETTITEPNGAVTYEVFNIQGLPTRIIHAHGTLLASETAFYYDLDFNTVAVVDPDKHTTLYTYNGNGDRTSEKNADGNETKWTYDSTHDIDSETTPDGETTTIKRNADGDPETIERAAPGSTTQKTSYKYDADGEVESMTNPLERTWKYEYDSYGDRKAETDPEGNKRTWEYNEDSQKIAEVSPRGNAAGAKASEFTTKFELNAKGQPLKITDPLSHTTKYTYDGNGNVETTTDGNSHTTKYTYDSDNELTKTEEPNKAVTETEYDSMGQVKSQTDGNKHITKYVRNALEEVEEVVNPLGKKTLKEYDAAGNLVKLTDPAKRTITYKYDPANRLEEVSYSSGKPATVKYEYNKDGDRIKMTDGTGTDIRSRHSAVPHGRSHLYPHPSPIQLHQRQSTQLHGPDWSQLVQYRPRIVRKLLL
jgi:YD repeat-containing protein